MKPVTARSVQDTSEYASEPVHCNRQTSLPRAGAVRNCAHCASSKVPASTDTPLASTPLCQLIFTSILNISQIYSYLHQRTENIEFSNIQYMHVHVHGQVLLTIQSAIIFLYFVIRCIIQMMKYLRLNSQLHTGTCIVHWKIRVQLGTFDEVAQNGVVRATNLLVLKYTVYK